MPARIDAGLRDSLFGVLGSCGLANIARMVQ